MCALKIKINDFLKATGFLQIAAAFPSFTEERSVDGLIFCENIASLEKAPENFIIILNRETFINFVSEDCFKLLNRNKVLALCFSGSKEDVTEIHKKLAKDNDIIILVCLEIISIGSLMKRISDILYNENYIYYDLKNFPIELIEKTSIKSLLLSLSETCGCNVAYRDTINNRTFVGSNDANFTEQTRTYPLQELKKIFDCFEVIDERYECGFFIIEKNIKLPSSIINSVLLGLKLNIRKDIQNRIYNKQHYINLFTDIIEDRIQDNIILLQRLRSINIRKNYRCFCMLMIHEIQNEEKYNDYQKNLWMDAVEKNISFYFNRVFVIHRLEYTLSIVLLDDEQNISFMKFKEQLVNSCRVLFDNTMLNLNIPNIIGISSIKDSLMNLKEALSESRNAVIYATTNDIKRLPIFWDDLGAFKAICSLLNNFEAKKHYNRILSKIFEYDKSHSGELVETLIQLEANNWNARLVSDRLHFHPNTIRYRINKICELLDGDINDSDFRFDLVLAIKLHQIYSWEEKQGVNKDAFFNRAD